MQFKSRLSDLLIETKDGEWGKGEALPDFIPMQVIRGTDFNDVRSCDLKNVPTRFIAQHIAKRKRLQIGDVLIETAGGSKGNPTGRTVFIGERVLANADLPLTCASFSRFLRPDKNLVEPQFLYCYLQWLYKSGVMETYQVQHTGIARFQYTKFASEVIIDLPPLPEQHAIARVLGCLDDKIELNRRTNATLEQMAQTLFRAWFVDFAPVKAKAAGVLPPGLDAETAALFPSEFQESTLGLIPKGWDVCAISDLVEVVGGGTPSTKVAEYWDGEHSWATPKDLSALRFPILLQTERKITEGGLKKISSGLLPRGAVLLSSRAPIGYLAIAEIPVAINQGFIAMIPRENISNLFVLHWAKENLELIKSRANGSTFLEISKSNFRPLQLTYPPRELMEIFDQKTRGLFEKMVNNEKQSQALAQLRDALLPRLISGRLRVPDAEAWVEASEGDAVHAY